MCTVSTSYGYKLSLVGKSKYQIISDISDHSSVLEMVSEFISDWWTFSWILSLNFMCGKLIKISYHNSFTLLTFSWSPSNLLKHHFWNILLSFIDFLWKNCAHVVWTIWIMLFRCFINFIFAKIWYYSYDGIIFNT